jgi:hypothetical protein
MKAIGRVMGNVLLIIGILVGWVLLTQVILPKFGVPT